MALKHLCSMLVIAVVAAGCSRSAAPAAAPEEPEALSVTRWTDKTELFAEYPPLVVGSTSRFAHPSHAARLVQGAHRGKRRSAPARRLRAAGGIPRGCAFSAGNLRSGREARTRRQARARDRAEGHGLSDEHRVGEVDVHPNAEAAAPRPQRAGEDAPGISFLKEQQWSLDFGTALVKEQAVRESIRVPARLEARPGGAADVVAPIDGRLTRVVDVPLGASVSRGQELARLLPPPSVPGDLPQLQRARAEAQTALALATRDRERAERLTSAGAAPAKRLDEARSAEEQAKARLTAAEASLAQYNAARAGGADGRRGNVRRSGAGERRDRSAQRHDGRQCCRGNGLVSGGRCVAGPRGGAGSGSGGGARPTRARGRDRNRGAARSPTGRSSHQHWEGA